MLDPAKRDPNERYCSLGDKLAEMGRYGQKTGLCFYERLCFSKTVVVFLLLPSGNFYSLEVCVALDWLSLA